MSEILNNKIKKELGSKDNSLLHSDYQKLFALTLMHLLVDVFAGFLPAVLPALRNRFGLSITMGIIIITFFNITVNYVQIAVGHLRAKNKKPLFMLLGFVFAVAGCFIYFLPKNLIGIIFLFVILFIGGSGVALFHPESMRALHQLRSIPSSIRTPVIVMGGYFGFSGGSWLGSLLVEQMGFKGLLLMAPIALAGIFLFFFIKFELKTEEISTNNKKEKTNNISIWLLFIMAFQTTTAIMIITILLPTHLNLYGFKLSFGGMAAFIFCLGLGFGGIFWGVIARKIGEFKISIISLFLSIPIIIIYIILSHFPLSVILLFFCGVCAGGCYPMLLSMSRNAKGMNLGGRMAFMVGGVWGVSSIIMLFLTPLAEYVEKNYHNLGIVLHVAWIFILTSGLFGFYIIWKIKKVNEDRTA